VRSAALLWGLGVLALVVGLLFGDVATPAQSSPAGGMIKVWLTPSNTGSGGTVLITGAIAD
jgi:hypothetical protein